MKTHLIGISLGTLTCVLSLWVFDNFSTGKQTETVKIRASAAAFVKIENRILERKDLSLSEWRSFLLNAASNDARRFWNNIGKETYSEIEFLEITLDDKPSSPSYLIKMKLVPNKKSAFDANPQVFYAVSDPDRKALSWNVEEETFVRAEISKARFVFKKTEPRFREIRPGVFLAE